MIWVPPVPRIRGPGFALMLGGLTLKMHFSASQCPERIVTSESVTQGKPDPAPYLAGAALLGFAPQECEDSSRRFRFGSEICTGRRLHRHRDHILSFDRRAHRCTLYSSRSDRGRSRPCFKCESFYSQVDANSDLNNPSSCAQRPHHRHAVILCERGPKRTSAWGW